MKKNVLYYVFFFCTLFIIVSCNKEKDAENTDEIVNIPDPILQAWVRLTINKPTGNIYKNEVNTLQKLDESNLYSIPFPFRGITNLEGLQYFTQLKSLHLTAFKGSSIAQVRSLNNLETFSIDGLENYISFNALSGLNKLKYVGVSSKKDTIAQSNILDIKYRNVDFDMASLYQIPSIEAINLGGYAGAELSVSNWANIKDVLLGECNSLASLSGFNGKKLEVFWAEKLPALTTLPELDTAAASLTLYKVLLSDVKVNISQLQYFRGIRQLYLNYIPELKNVLPITNSKLMRTLEIIGCPKVENIEAIAVLSKLNSVSLCGTPSTLEQRRIILEGLKDPYLMINFCL
jgi:hypothetical protein